MKIKLCEGGWNGAFEVFLLHANNRKSEESVYFQSDWDFPGLASTFGWIPCSCGMTDGTVDCKHKTRSSMIADAYDFLVKNLGAVAENPGYFEGPPATKAELAEAVG
jgi:hypothetical protein